MSIEIRAACSPGEIRAAVLDKGALRDFGIWRPGMPDGVGDVYRGRIAAVAPALAGAFVELGNQDGFLPDGEGAKGLHNGDAVTVRIARAAQAGKGARLSARGVAAEVGPVGLVSRGPGVLRDYAAAHPQAPVLIDDAAMLAALRPALGARIKLVPCAFDHELDHEIAALFEPTLELVGGGAIHFEPTRALVAIDVDSGLGGGRGERSRDHLAANRAMLPILARQIRLRDLAGTIMVDFAGLPARKRALLGAELASHLGADPQGARLSGFTPLGLAEIVRTRRHPPLHELGAGAHAAGLRALRAAIRNPLARLRLRARPAIVMALETDSMALSDYTRVAAFPIDVVSDPGVGGEGWMIESL